MSIAEIVSYSPVSGEAVGAVPVTDAQRFDTEVRRAAAAFAEGTWSSSPLLRAQAMHRWADALEREAESIADVIVSEVGKIFFEARLEVVLAVDALRYNAGLTRHVDGQAGPMHDGSISYLERRPVGVAGFIVPWNSPVALLVRDLAPALAAGTTAVVKPSPLASLSVQRVIEVGYSAGVPEDVIRIVYGDVEIGRALVEHPAVRAIGFTGSTSTGREIMRLAANDFTRVLLELGGKSASVVFADADIPRAIDSLVASSVVISGQFCMATTRVLVERSAYPEALERVVEKARGLRVGDPYDPASNLGPLISKEHRDHVLGYVDLARQTAKVVAGGEPADEAGAGLTPTVITDVELTSPIVRDEIFGPVLTVEPFDGEADAVVAANASPYGLVSSVWTKDGDRAWRVARGIDAGTVWVNRYNRSFAEMPSGGTKDSGFGRTRGIDGLRQFTEPKHINWQIS